MKKKLILKILMFGGLGSILIGITTGQWIQGSILCLTISSIAGFSEFKRKKVN